MPPAPPALEGSEEAAVDPGGPAESLALAASADLTGAAGWVFEGLDLGKEPPLEVEGASLDLLLLLLLAR